MAAAMAGGKGRKKVSAWRVCVTDGRPVRAESQRAKGQQERALPYTRESDEGSKHPAQQQA